MQGKIDSVAVRVTLLTAVLAIGDLIGSSTQTGFILCQPHALPMTLTTSLVSALYRAYQYSRPLSVTGASNLQSRDSKGM